MLTPNEILKRHWGFDTFKKPQLAIIEAVLKRKNVIALLPTGGGKSVCFQVPALLKEGVCIVISPLISLMEDQVTNLRNKNIKATTIPSGSSEDEIIILFDTIRYGNYKFLYISPERIQSKFIQQKIAQLNVNLIAIDEAHCISEWGHDFRPSYRNLRILQELHPYVNCIALTATATLRVIQDIQTTLGFENPSLFKKSFERKNLAYKIQYTEDKLNQLTRIFSKNRAPAIVYVNSRKKTQELSRFLNAQGFSSDFYHAGLSAINKKEAFERWMLERTQIIVATNAFGMGIDKPNVQTVVHYNLPNSIENYIQEAGRAGRNGAKASAILLTNANDVLLKKEIYKKTHPTKKEIKFIHKKLYQYFRIAKGELRDDAFDFDILDFCDRYQLPKHKTFNSLQILNNNEVINYQSNTQKKSSFRFLVTSKVMLQYKSNNAKTVNFIDNLLRMYSGFSEQYIKIDEFYLAKKTGITSTQVIEHLERMAHDEVIEYKKNTSNGLLSFLVPREDDKTINSIAKKIKFYLKQKAKKIKKIIAFAENNSLCRNVQILAYFGEEHAEKCGICDVCLHEKDSIKNNTAAILKLLENKSLTLQEICTNLGQEEKHILITLRFLLSEEKISLTATQKYYLQ